MKNIGKLTIRSLFIKTHRYFSYIVTYLLVLSILFTIEDFIFRKLSIKIEWEYFILIEFIILGLLAAYIIYKCYRPIDLGLYL